MAESGTSAAAGWGLWDERFWLPGNVTWAELEELGREPGNFSSFWYLLWPVPAGFLLIALRFVLTLAVFKPLGVALGLKIRPRRQAHPNPVLENAYLESRASSGASSGSNGAPGASGSSVFSDRGVAKLAAQVGWTPRQVQRWVRVRRQQGRHFSTLDKFGETM